MIPWLKLDTIPLHSHPPRRYWPMSGDVFPGHHLATHPPLHAHPLRGTGPCLVMYSLDTPPPHTHTLRGTGPCLLKHCLDTTQPPTHPCTPTPLRGTGPCLVMYSLDITQPPTPLHPPHPTPLRGTGPCQLKHCLEPLQQFCPLSADSAPWTLCRVAVSRTSAVLALDWWCCPMPPSEVPEFWDGYSYLCNSLLWGSSLQEENGWSEEAKYMFGNLMADKKLQAYTCKIEGSLFFSLIILFIFFLPSFPSPYIFCVEHMFVELKVCVSFLVVPSTIFFLLPSLLHHVFFHACTHTHTYTHIHTHTLCHFASEENWIIERIKELHLLLSAFCLFSAMAESNSVSKI